MAPRGLKTALQKSAPGTLVGNGKLKRFEILNQGSKTGTKLKGVTKKLTKKIWSTGTLPLIARSGTRRPGGHWGGAKGGQTRGKKVDAQLTRLINSGPSAFKNANHVYNLTKMALSALSKRGLEPVCAQRVVVSEKHRIGTAADIVAYSKKENSLVIVELKTGFDHGRKAAAEKNGVKCKMGKPLQKVNDCVVNRHLAQLAVTRHLFVQEKKTVTRLGELGLEQDVQGILLYVNDEGAEFYTLPDWWKKRSGKLLEALA